MSAAGRGRGYIGRHHMRAEPRPGDIDTSAEEMEAARTLAELSPRSPDPTKMEPKPEKRAAPDRDDHHDDKMRQDDEAALAELLTIDEQYTPLLVLLDQFTAGEDGIQFNRKLRHFESTITSLCPDETRLLQAFATFRAGALTSSSTARALAAAGASFTRQQRQQPLRAALLTTVMQGAYCKLDVLQRANPQFLINAANLMGDYFAEARLCNGNKVHILAEPLLHYMKALLASDDIRAHRSLATQLMQNGRELLSLLSTELDELSIAIRMRLLTPPPVSIVWLLLSADLCLNKFLPLPNTLQQFYASHLDLSQEDSTYNEVNYGSWKKEAQDVDKVGQNVSNLSINEEEVMKPKLRPILGAGAGLLRQDQVSQDTWTTKSLSKRYDLNSWRQNEEEEREELVFNPTVLPPNMMPPMPPTLPSVPSSTKLVPDYPPPNTKRYFPDYNYLQQGDGAYIQNQYTDRQTVQAQGDGFEEQIERQVSVEKPNVQERVNSEVQKSSRPVENWRKDKEEKKWRTSKDNVNDDEEKRNRRGKDQRVRPRRDSEETQKRNVLEPPRSQKYWDHDDRCDIDYNS